VDWPKSGGFFQDRLKGGRDGSGRRPLQDKACHGARTRHTYQNTEADRAVAEADTAGFSRLMLHHRGRVIGASVVGPRAGEALAQLTLAIRRGLRAATRRDDAPLPDVGGRALERRDHRRALRLGSDPPRAIVRGFARRGGDGPTSTSL